MNRKNIGTVSCSPHYSPHITCSRSQRALLSLLITYRGIDERGNKLEPKHTYARSQKKAKIKTLQGVQDARQQKICPRCTSSIKHLSGMYISEGSEN